MFLVLPSLWPVGRFAVLCACVGAVLCGCSSPPPTFDSAAETAKIDQAIVKVQSDPQMSAEQKKKAVSTLEGMKPTEPRK